MPGGFLAEEGGPGAGRFFGKGGGAAEWSAGGGGKGEAAIVVLWFALQLLNRGGETGEIKNSLSQ